MWRVDVASALAFYRFAALSGARSDRGCPKHKVLDGEPVVEALAMSRSYLPERHLREISEAEPKIVIVCEHAANAIPPEYGDLGLDGAARQSHIAWDPGALGVAREMRRLFDGDLVAGSVSRLLYDCNRPPEAPSAMPERSESFVIPGNCGLTAEQREARTVAIYRPFREALSGIMATRGRGVLVTVHSFTPVFHGVRRTCEIGLLHDADARLAEAMLAEAAVGFPFKVECNVPYSAKDGVTHTLEAHAVARGWPNVMIEIRNDLIATPAQQVEVACQFVILINKALPHLEALAHV